MENDKYFYREIGRKMYHQTSHFKGLHSEQSKRRQLKKKMVVMIHYSGDPPKCACCGESHIEFLSIDHINGGGSRQRKSLRISHFYEWLIKNNFPEGYQVLCMNCNWAKSHGGCPHQNC